MNKTKQFGLTALLLALAQLGALAQTTFFTDTFTSSTTNASSIRTGSPTASATSYDIASTKNTTYTTNGVFIAPNDLRLALQASTSSGFLEAQAMFATNGKPVTLSTVGDYIDIQVVFTNTYNWVMAVNTAPMWIGLFNSGGSLPLTTNLFNSGLTTTAGSPYATGNAAGWVGYVAAVANGGTSKTYTRPVQNAGLTDSANQDLLGSNFGSGAFDNPAGTSISSVSTSAFTLTNTVPYTLDLRLTLTSATSLSITNFIYGGVGTNGTVLMTQGSSTGITNATFLTTIFDSFAIGLTSKSSVNPIMDISSITVSGQSTPITTPPTITTQPVPAVVASNGACQFTVAAVGSGVAYQWYRNGAVLANGGDVSGATTPQLIISQAKTADAVSGANGYFCDVSGTGGYSTNSATNSLTLIGLTNLTWTAAGGATWDLNNTVSWQDSNNNPLPFNYGDSVVFDDTASSKFVTLSGSFLSASSVTVNSGSTYSFSGSGSIAGPGNLVYAGTGQLTLNVANTFSGGTLVSNTVSPASQYVYLENYAGLGTGPVTLDNNGGTMEIVPTGGATTGINGDINLLDNFNIQLDGVGTYAGVFLGDLSGVSGKTLTINPENPGTTNRIRAYGINTVDNANLVLDTLDSSVSQAIYNGTVFAPYGTSGSQTYNGVISGYGGIAQRGNNTTYLNNNQNTYSGGTFPTAGTLGLGADSVPTSGTVTSGPLGTGPLFLAPEVGSATGTGTMFASGGAHTIANPIQFPSGTNNLTLVIGGTNNLTFTGPVGLNGLDGTTSATYPSRLISVTNTGATTLSGVISDSSSFFALTKSGSGALYLNAANTYPGVTTNSAGLLAGTGSLAGSVVVTTNATIGGGTATSFGTFTIGGSLTLSNGGGFFRLSRAGTPTSDEVSVGGTISAIGLNVITVTNLGAPLQVGDTFTLFSKAVGGSGTLNIAGGDTGVTWTNKLAVNGTIQVFSLPSPVNTNAFTLTNSYASGSLTLTWPLNHTGYRLQAQTNTLAVGLGTNWVTVGSINGVVPTQTNHVAIPVSATNPAVYYRLVYP